ncbi:MAG TPA: 50S ribosomal protein L4 [Candidatus Margulisiibacteriota bacterium]|nr:50S ribosomal protein L4 [Candidatus Margulisiibacteriota bacterium]
MEALTLPVYNQEGKETGSIKLNASVFDGKVNSDAIHQAVNEYRANQRCGLASTKTRGEVSGGGKKPWKQKGTGRARVGSTRSPLWRHGGVIFGPHPRDFSFSIPRKIKLLALKSSLNAKVKENNLIILEELKFASTKTKEAAGIFANLKVNSRKEKNVLLLLKKVEGNTGLTLRNIGFLDVNLSKLTHTYEIMSHGKLIITRDGLEELIDRLKK